MLQTLYPPTLVGFEDNEITIAQGSDFFSLGDKLVVKRMGNALRDPHSGEFLSYDQSDIGRAEVTYVDARITKARLTGQVPIDQKLVLNKKYQVWRTGESVGDFFASLEGNAPGGGAASGKKAGGKLFSTDNDDE